MQSDLIVEVSSKGDLAKGAADFLESAMEYVGNFRNMNQISKLYWEVKALANQYTCRERVPVTIFLERMGTYYDYKGIGLGWDHIATKETIFVQDYLIGCKGCSNLKISPYPEWRQGQGSSF